MKNLFFWLLLLIVSFSSVSYGKVKRIKQEFNIISIEGCTQQADDYFKKDENSSQLAMNVGAQMDKKCIVNVMNMLLDKRLLMLKTSNPIQFKIEMELQHQFNIASQAFESFFYNKCEGSGCTTCSPVKALAYYRAYQAKEINEGRLNVSSIKTERKIIKQIKSGFKSFSVGLCKMPKNIWKEGLQIPNCSDYVIEEIAKKLEPFFSSPKNEGDICGRL